MSNGLLWPQTSIRPHLENQLVIICDLSDASIGYGVIHLLDGRKDGIDGMVPMD